MVNKVDVCVIPAAGRGSRWAPVSGYLPKEMLPLIDKPVIEWVIDEVVSSKCKEIIIVINRQKLVIKEYLLKKPKYKRKKIKFHFINQKEPQGLAPAIYLTKKIIGNRDFSVALPDLPTISKKPVMGQLMKFYKGNHLISFSNFSPNTLHFYSECLTKQRKDKLLDIIHFCPKVTTHKPHHKINKIRMSGRYVFSNNIFSTFEKLLAKKTAEEINEVEALKLALENKQRVLGFQISGHTYDTGTPAGYVRANTAFFKKFLAKKT